MEYSFSQTFGRGAVVLQDSPTPSLHSSNTGGSKNRSIEGIDRSPVLESYQIGGIVRAYNQNGFVERINHLSKQARSYSHFSKSKQQIHRQADIKLKTEMKNVDGLNQRMVNLINELKKDYNISSKPEKQYHRASDSNNKENTPKIDRSASACLIKKPSVLSQYNQRIYLEEHKHNNFSTKRFTGIQTQRQRIYDDPKLKYKNKIQSKLNSENENIKIKQHKYEKKDNSEKYVMPSNSKNNYVDIKAKVTGSMEQNYLKQFESSQKHKSVAFSKGRENKKQSWLKSKVKTIESQMQTTSQWRQLENNIGEFHEYSYVEDDKAFRKTKENTNQLGPANNEDCRNCEDCGLRKEVIECKNNWNHDSTIEQSQVQKGYPYHQSFDFQNKLKSISQKIDNYQKKLQSSGLDNRIFSSKGSTFSSTKNSMQSQNSRSMPFRKTSKVENNPSVDKAKLIKIDESNDELEYQFQERKHTPTWGELSSQGSTQRIKSMHSFHLPEMNNSERREKIQKPISKVVYSKTESARQPRLNEMSLRQRMSYKLSTNNSALKICKQIQLDEELRRLKKQLSKLPDEVPELLGNKWEYIASVMQVRCKSSCTLQTREIFQLKDDEADPFFSIAVEDLQAYQQIVIGIIEAYKKTQTYFYENILHGLPLIELNQMFRPSLNLDNEVKLDEFTLVLSNATKINHKCRDVYLLFRRILSFQNKEDRFKIQNEKISIQRENLIAILSEDDAKKPKQSKNSKYQGPFS